MTPALALIAAVLLGPAAPAQEIPANAPKFIKFAKAPGVEVRFLDFRWDEAAFDAVENGGSHPAAQRSWVLARLMLQQDPLRFKGKMIPVGPVILVLNPRRGQTPATLEFRYIDMREVFVDMNVIAEPPEGQTYQKVDAVFARTDTVLPRLEVTIEDRGKTYDLAIGYGNRKATLTLER